MNTKWKTEYSADSKKTVGTKPEKNSSKIIRIMEGRYTGSKAMEHIKFSPFMGLEERKSVDLLLAMSFLRGTAEILGGRGLQAIQKNVEQALKEFQEELDNNPKLKGYSQIEGSWGVSVEICRMEDKK